MATVDPTFWEIHPPIMDFITDLYSSRIGESLVAFALLSDESGRFQIFLRKVVLLCSPGALLAPAPMSNVF